MRIFAAALFALMPVHAATAWSTAQAENLLRWVERAQGEGLDLPSRTTLELREAIDAGDPDRLEPVANDAARMLMRAWRGRCCGASRPSWWHINGRMKDDDLHAGLESALQADQLDLYLRSIRPSHAYYARLIEALSAEQDSDRRTIIAANLARWRWLPARMGERYLIANIPSGELTLWEQGKVAGRWRVIFGKPQTRTPVFATDVSGVVLNPWWEIPPSIAAEGIARFVQRNPSAARARGYIYQNGRYRQMPGDNNALGRMKLVMPNRFSVFLHDTSNRELFEEEQRYFSHGCVRVDRALSFAATILTRDGWDLARIEAAVASEDTQTIPLSEKLPLYVTYFTVEPAPFGRLNFFDDVYRRDPVVLSASARSELESLSRALLTPASWAFDLREDSRSCPA